jgi:hypothetical protein
MADQQLPDSGNEADVNSKRRSIKSVTSNHKKLILLSTILLVVAIVGALYVFRESWMPQQNNTVKEAETQISTQPQPVVDEETKRFISPTTGEKWYDEPKVIASQGYMAAEFPEYYAYEEDPQKLEEMMKQNAPKSYSEVGTRGENTIILVMAQGGIGGYYPYLFEKQPDGTVHYIARPQTFTTLTDEIRTSNDQMLSDEVAKSDESVQYDSLSVPASFSLTSGEKLTRPEYTGLGEETVSYDQTEAKKIKIADYGQSTLNRIERTYTDTKLSNIGYYVETVLGTSISVEYEPNTLSLEKYSWTNNQPAKGPDYNGAVVFDTIAGIARGCGGVSAAVTRSDNLKLADLMVVGKTDTSREVYQPKEKSHELIKKSYEEYVAWQKVVEAAPVTLDEFLAAHGIVVIKNADGELLVYVRSQYAPAYGCAKPVVYLYPTQPTSVDVRVGANVVVSEPLYPVGGWKNVFAKPDGKLTYNGINYDSLFWEGPGIGDYPVVNAGTVVRYADARSTMEKQLKQQGLNQKETDDFMEFWSDKIPQKPYVRLTWLSTAQMDELAPLYVIPKPDTVKRVFLDMAGLDKPVKLPAQKLSGFQRQGFTVVEWGGVTQMINR